MRSVVQAAIILVGLLGAGAGTAQTNGDGPAELPPADFAGRQYVDSRGCVFIRAQVDGTVSWAARLTADRQPLCGFQPTFAGGTPPATGSLPTVRPDAPPAAVEAAPAVAEAAPAAAPVAAAPRRVRSAAPAVRAAPPRASTTGVPKGYRPVWEDDRLNPQRAKGTARGEEMMRRLWTDDVPMRLVSGGR